MFRRLSEENSSFLFDPTAIRRYKIQIAQNLWAFVRSETVRQWPLSRRVRLAFRKDRPKKTSAGKFNRKKPMLISQNFACGTNICQSDAGNREKEVCSRLWQVRFLTTEKSQNFWQKQSIPMLLFNNDSRCHFGNKCQKRNASRLKKLFDFS